MTAAALGNALALITAAPDSALRMVEGDLRALALESFDPVTETGGDDALLATADAIDGFLYVRRNTVRLTFSVRNGAGEPMTGEIA